MLIMEAIRHYLYRAGGLHRFSNPAAASVEEIAEQIKSEYRVVGKFGNWDIVEQDGRQFFRTETAFVASVPPWPGEPRMTFAYIAPSEGPIVNLPALLETTPIPTLLHREAQTP